MHRAVGRRIALAASIVCHILFIKMDEKECFFYARDSFHTNVTSWFYCVYAVIGFGIVQAFGSNNEWERGRGSQEGHHLHTTGVCIVCSLLSLFVCTNAGISTVKAILGKCGWRMRRPVGPAMCQQHSYYRLDSGHISFLLECTLKPHVKPYELCNCCIVQMILYYRTRDFSSPPPPLSASLSLTIWWWMNSKWNEYIKFSNKRIFVFLI